MSLQDKIKQTKPFSSKKEQVLVNVIYTNNWIYFRQNKLFKPFDISIQQYNVLRILNGQKDKPITINEIIDRMLDKMSNASRLVDKLVQKNYVNRVQKEDNRRACDVTITKEGSKVLEQMNKVITSLEDDLGDLSEVELDELNRLLDKVRSKY